MAKTHLARERHGKGDARYDGLGFFCVFLDGDATAVPRDLLLLAMLLSVIFLIRHTFGMITYTLRMRVKKVRASSSHR